MNAIVFWLLSSVSVVSALFVVSKRSPMASALSLAVCLTALAGLFAALMAPFLFIIQILVYAGAVVVLIVFVIMLLNLRPDELKAQAIQKGKFWGSAVLCALSALVVARLAVSSSVAGQRVVAGDFGTVERIADELFTTYLLPFEVVSLILLIGILGAVVVAKRGE